MSIPFTMLYAADTLTRRGDPRATALAATLTQLAAITPEGEWDDDLSNGFLRASTCPTPEGGNETACEARRLTCKDLWMVTHEHSLPPLNGGPSLVRAAEVWQAWLTDAESRPTDPRSVAMAATFKRELAWIQAAATLEA